jgi:glutathione peroxidase
MYAVTYICVMMKSIFGVVVVSLLLVACGSHNEESKKEPHSKQITESMDVYDIKVKQLDGTDFDWSDYKGKRLMIVNVASECGLTPQYEQLQAMYKDLDTSKYAIIGVPANNFLKQEPGKADDIARFCTMNYGVEFPILEKMNVCDKVYLSSPPNPDNAEAVETSPLYAYLTKKSINGNLDIDMLWNFQKILVNENGQVYDYAQPREIDPFILLDKLSFTN